MFGIRRRLRLTLGDEQSFWAGDRRDVIERLRSGDAGLTDDQAASALLAQRLLLKPRHPHGVAPWLRLLLGQFGNPIILILVAATIISIVAGDLLDGLIILAIILASGLLGFWQEYRANADVAALLRTVEVTVPVLRSGREVAVPVRDVVPGDVVLLRAGGVVPADCRLLTGDDLLVDESTLTGEAFPVEKQPDALIAADCELTDRLNSVFLGTHVVSGDGRAIAVRTGARTHFGTVTEDLQSRRVVTAFTRGTTRFGFMLLRLMLLLTAFIFAVNWLLGRPLIDSLLFSLSLAVGITPQMLPAIVSLSLSTGARRMAKQRVIVKRLDSIEDLGSLTVLCTDKTGTITEGAAVLSGALGPDGAENPDVLALASLNAGLQEAFRNPLDAAILSRQRPPAGAALLSENPYDFTRRRLTVLTPVDGAPQLISKGALEGMLAICATVRTSEGAVPIHGELATLRERFSKLSAQGFRVLGLATRSMPPGTATIGIEDETGLEFRGFLAFHDPVKQDAAAAITELGALGVSVCIVTGDNRLVAAAIASSVGLDAATVLTGAEIDVLDDEALAQRVIGIRVFAEVEPLHKRRIVAAIRSRGETVAFLGDGINDAPALHAADIGISVNTAVDVAKEAATVVLLDKDLAAIIAGVKLGRETFANTLKYVRVTTSANFGNMISMAVASVFLPFLPLLPRQILLLNFLSDFPATTIAADRVDPEQVVRPGTWDLRSIRTFMIVFGALSTMFDLTTFAVLIWGFDAGDAAFRSAWFIESTLTEIAVLLSLRTARPLLRSRPGIGLLVSSAAVGVLTVALPYIPAIGGPLGLEPVALPVILLLFALTVGYLLANEVLKTRFLGNGGPVRTPVAFSRARR